MDCLCQRQLNVGVDLRVFRRFGCADTGCSGLAASQCNSLSFYVSVSCSLSLLCLVYFPLTFSLTRSCGLTSFGGHRLRSVFDITAVPHLSFSLPHTEGSQRDLVITRPSFLDHLDSALLISVEIKFQAGFHVALR